MRWGLVGGVFLSALVIAVGAAEPAGVALPSRSQLKLMPLPHASYGAQASSLSLDSDSGWVSNKDSAEDRARPNAYGGSAHAHGADHRLRRRVRRSDEGIPARPARRRRQRGRSLSHRGGRGSLHRAGGRRVSAAGREAPEVRHRRRSGFLLRRDRAPRGPGRPFPSSCRWADVLGDWSALSGWNPRRERRARPHGRSRRARRRSAARGRSQPADPWSPRGQRPRQSHRNGYAEAGRPRPSGRRARPLASMAIAPGDFDGRARPTYQGYVRNTDDIADYVREFRSVTFGSSALAWLKSEVELRPSAKAANDFVSLLRSLLHGPRGRTFMQAAITSGFSPSDRKEVRIGRVSQLKVQEGDASVALSTSFTTRGLSFQFVLTIVQRDRVVETLGAVSPPRGAIRLVDTRRLARTAVARIDQALHD